MLGCRKSSLISHSGAVTIIESAGFGGALSFYEIVVESGVTLLI
jgi:hypothetical protein